MFYKTSVRCDLNFNFSILSCAVYEEARQAGLNPVRNGVGYDEDGREWDEKADSFGCDFYEECCGEGCIYGEIGQEECF